MVRLRSGQCTRALEDKAPGSCCWSRRRAAFRGHFECYTALLPHQPERYQTRDLFPLLHLALRRGKEAFVRRMLVERKGVAFDFAENCACMNDESSLRFVLGAGLRLNLRVLCRLSANSLHAGILRAVLEHGAPWEPAGLCFAAGDNRLDILEVVLRHSREWSCPRVPSRAACAGNARFLMLAHEAGCPLFTSAHDGEPHSPSDWFPSSYYPAGKKGMAALPDWGLVVSSDLVRSGPVLLYAAKKSAPLTPRMRLMLGEVRGRALALAGCFRTAARLSGAPGVEGRRWKAMGGVPIELVQNIATQARISIVVKDLVE